MGLQLLGSYCCIDYVAASGDRADADHNNAAVVDQSVPLACHHNLVEDLTILLPYMCHYHSTLCVMLQSTEFRIIAISSS